DNRTALFARDSPDAIEPGSIVLVEQISSRSSPRKLAFAGILLAVNRRGLLSTITVRNYVLGTGVEVVYPVYSPMVTRIKVLKRVQPGFANGKDNVKFLRDKPGAA
ncbi:translation protein SH3-like domain-containing protein, partial [Chytriomyces sp. MP71]